MKTTIYSFWQRSFIVLCLVLSTTLSAQVLPDFTGLVEDTAPAIVNISTSRAVDDTDILEEFGGDRERMEEFFRLFGDQIPGGLGQGEQESASLGSGFIISEDGYIVTNHHVIDGADEITVTLNDQRQFDARVIGSDQRSDLALLKITAEGLPTIAFGDIADVKAGQWVLAIGSPFNLSHSVAVGIVSYVGRSLPQYTGQGNYVSFIQTDVAINPGHSGGPLLNLNGEVIGVNSQIYSNSGGSIGVSFSIPVDVAANVTSQLMQTGSVERGWMGVSIVNVTQEQADEFGLATPRGAYVNGILPGGPAEQAGFREEDIIVTYEGVVIRDSADLPYHVGLTMPGTEVEIGVIRNGEPTAIRMVVGNLDGASTQEQIELSALEPLQDYLGMAVSSLSSEELEDMGLDAGLRIDAVNGGPAAEAGMQAGDILLSMDGIRLESLIQFVRVVGELPLRSPIPVLVQRDGRQSFFTLLLEN